MDTAVRTEENESTFPSRAEKGNRDLGGFFFAVIVALCYEFLSWVASLRREQQQN